MFKPTTFGKFFLYEKLAIGGMAEIFKAKLYGIAGFEKTLVVKQILPEFATDNEFVKMFIDEANIAVSLTHGNIVPVYELGKIADRYYIAMEYVDGENLETIVDQVAAAHRDIPVNLCVEIVIEVCKGLDYAHRKSGENGVSLGIVHRDVSPQNLMVSFDGEVKIVDFGIAKATSKLSLTRVGTLKGKFGYMSPEQAMGADVDRRTDVYAAGIVLYEILTSRKLFEAENDLDLLKKVRAGVVIPPSTLDKRIPPELDRLVMKALARDMATRYQAASEFQMDLQRWLYSRPADPTEDTLSNFMRSLFRREPPRAAVAVAGGAPLFGDTELGPPPQPQDRDRSSRRDISFAQNDTIARALEQASREARRVMGDEDSNDHTVAHEETFQPPEDLVAEGEASVSVSAGTSPLPVEGEFSTEMLDVDNYQTVDAADDGTRTSESSDEVIEFDETTSHIAVRLSSDTSVVERPTVEGPIVRIPSASRKNVVRTNSPAPPWSSGAVPDGIGEQEETNLQRREVLAEELPVVAGTMPGLPPVASSQPPPPPPPSFVQRTNGGVPVAVSPQDGPFVQRSLTRPGGLSRLRLAAYTLLSIAGLAAIGIVVQHRLSAVEPVESLALPSPTHTALALLSPTAVAVTTSAKPSPTATPRPSPTATPTVVPTATPTPTPTPAPTPVPEPTSRRVTVDSSPAGVAVFSGSKRLGTTPLTVTLGTGELGLRFAKSGFHELKKSYPPGTTTLHVNESLEALPARTPVPVAEFGTVSVNATPWGKVKIDGVFVKNTPLIKHKLKAGNHEIEVANPDFPGKTKRQSVAVHPNVDEDPIIVSFE